MAEGGGIGPRSNEGTPAYKAGSSRQLVALRIVHHGPKAGFRQESLPLDLSVMALRTVGLMVHSAKSLCAYSLVIDRQHFDCLECNRTDQGELPHTSFFDSDKRKGYWF
jgi:hypothetical protein